MSPPPCSNPALVLQLKELPLLLQLTLLAALMQTRQQTGQKSLFMQELLHREKGDPRNHQLEALNRSKTNRFNLFLLHRFDFTSHLYISPVRKVTF